MVRKKRFNALRKNMEADDLGALLVTKQENIFYLTSFSSDSVILIVTPDKGFVITDFRYAEAAKKEIGGFELIVLSGTLNTFTGAIAAVLSKKSIKKIGFESRDMTFARYRDIKSALKNKVLVPIQDAVESIREAKDASEMSDMVKALLITKETLRGVERILKPSLTEIDVARHIKAAFIQKGAEGTAFEPIVATQPGASQPHYKTSPEKKLGNNKPILIDMGARYNSYNSDLTRVCALGKINTKFTRLYQILIDAQRKAIDLIKPGAKISDVDNAARQYITDKGFGMFFGHSLGHGIGLEIHERPIISYRNTGVLKEGMVFTVEPGIYLPRYGGLRIEDTVCVTKEGCRVLTDDIHK